DSFEDFWKGED
nr:Chain B, Peptide from C-X-C chemokine receptor type 2 [Homo sapiens]6KVA_b Chain b, Peptide from C-X-C chemokine receptor type 2 [Homo sapiens]6KVF_B Chain B, Peptide from C-X-C chemokine receptor type 2 [Homo sapiens]6KVF_b Chain b, Peptide from C-X-C chemokine receptor type 2 [Homo sapiens]